MEDIQHYCVWSQRQRNEYTFWIWHATN